MKQSSLSRWGLTGLIGALMMTAVAPAAAQDALELYNTAAGAYRLERWQLAADNFGEFARKFPTHERVESARLYQGLALTNLQDYPAARKVWQAFVQDFPKSEHRPVALYRVAESSYLQGDHKAAEPAFQAFVADYPKHELAEWAWPFLGETQLELGSAAEAVESFQQALENFPKGRLLSDARIGLARAYTALDKGDLAVEQYRIVASDKTNPLAPQAQLHLATLLFDQKDYTAAAEAYEQIEDSFPKSSLVATAQLNAGYAWYQVGDYRKAIAKFDAAATAANQALTAKYWKGISLKSLGEYDQAATVLEETFEQAEGDPLADTVLYQWADCRLRNGDYERAEELFLDLVAKWPQSRFAADSLQLAGEAALLHARAAKDPEEQKQRIAAALAVADRFEKEYPDNPSQVRHELLYGRLLDLQGGEQNLRKAVMRFRKVLDGTATARTKLLAQFHLARTLQKLGEHKEVIASVAPLLVRVHEDGANSEFLGALVIAANSHLALGNDERVVALATNYLDLTADGPEADLALAARAVAHARRQEKAEVRVDLATLRDRFASSPLFPEKLLQVAETAYDTEDWDFAAEVFEMLVKLGPKTPQYAAGLSGLAWSRFEQKKYAEAAADFGKFLREFPDDAARSAEAAYMRGQALQNAGQLADAATAYKAALEKYGPEDAAPAKAETQRPLRFAFLSGLLAARTYDELEQTDQANVAYETLLAKFPEALELDKLLDEWALLNLRAERYDESDKIFRRLVTAKPDSDLADNARLSLAESDFVAGRLDTAKQAFQDLRTAKNSDPEVRERATFQLMELATDRQQWDEVLTMAQALRTEFPESTYRPTAAFRMSEAYLTQEKISEAQKLLQDLAAQKDDAAVTEARWFPRVWVLLAETYLRQKKYDEVRETVAAFAEMDPNNPRLFEAYEVLGRSYKNQANWEQARTAFEKVLADPAARGTETAAKAQLMIAETHWHQQDYTKAQTAYLKVYLIYNYPEWQAPALYQAGLCDEKLAQWDKAQKTYEEVVDQFPKSEYAAKAEDRLKLVREKAAG